VVKVCDVWQHDGVCQPLWAIVGPPPHQHSRWVPPLQPSTAASHASPAARAAGPSLPTDEACPTASVDGGGTAGNVLPLCVGAEQAGKACGAPSQCCPCHLLAASYIPCPLMHLLYAFILHGIRRGLPDLPTLHRLSSACFAAALPSTLRHHHRPDESPCIWPATACNLNLRKEVSNLHACMQEILKGPG
jgi:hypothetical protein